MQLPEALTSRRSVRQFDPHKPISDQQIQLLLKIAQWAPSAGNLQSYQLVIVKDQTKKDQLARAALEQDFISQAPIAIVSCANTKRPSSKYGQRGETLYAIQDATLVTFQLWLAAINQGLTGVWVGAFNETQVSKILKLKSHLRPIAILPLGYPAESPSPPPKRPLSEISHIIP